MKPYTTLGTYKWGRRGRYASKIGRELTDYTVNRLGLKPLVLPGIQRNPGAAWYDEDLHACVRMCAEPQSEATGWHQDGDTTVSREEIDFALVLWASRDHTQFKWPIDNTHQIYQPNAFDIVIAKNVDAFHRRPLGLRGGDSSLGSEWRYQNGYNNITSQRRRM